MLIPSLILIQITGALPALQETSAIRIDRVAYDSMQTVATPFIASKISANQAKFAVKALGASEAFAFNLTCSSNVSDNLCRLAREGLQNAGARIASLLQITTQITVQASFRPFCPASNRRCSQAQDLGGAVIGSFFAGLKENDPQLYMYPQALLKQLKTNTTLEYSNADILAQFNSDFPYYFRNNNQRMTNTLTDFEFVAVHELTHGLGFGTGLLQYSTVYPGITQPGYLAPNIFGDPTASNVSFLNPLSIYDSFVKGSNPFPDVGRTLATFPQQSSILPRFISVLEASKKHMAATQSAFQMSTRGRNSVQFQPIKGDGVNLYTPSQYEQGSSLSHVDTALSTTADFLMVPALAPGITLETIMANAGTDSVYGPGILGIMRSLGWPTRDDPTPAKVDVAIGFGKNGFINPLSSGASRLFDRFVFGVVLVLLI